MTFEQLRKPLLFVFASFVVLIVAAQGLLAQASMPDAPAASGSTPGLALSRFPEVFPAAASMLTPSSSSSSSGAPAIAVSSTLVAPPSAPERPRRFFDKWNLALFSGSAALDSADFAITRANLQSNGGKELNPVVRIFGRSTAGLALNFAGEAAGTIGLSYFFHKTGHYKLERAVSMVNIGASSIAVSYSASHR
jgi:hypothetical protein